MQSLICKGIVKSERLTSRMTFSFTTAALFVPRRWQSTSDTLCHRFLPANWTASKTRRSTKTESSSFGILASSHLPKRAGSPLRKRCALRRFTKKFIGISASNSSRSSQELWPSGSTESKRQYGQADNRREVKRCGLLIEPVHLGGVT